MKPFYAEELKLRIHNLLENAYRRTIAIEEISENLETAPIPVSLSSPTQIPLSQKELDWLEQLETGQAASVKEAAYSIGFKHTNYFSKSFEKRFGRRPVEYLG